jgi:hypothetical protein
MEIDPAESNQTFQDGANNRELQFPDELDGVCIQWLENVTSGTLNPMTRKDTRKYEYRVRATREVKGQADRLLMDTGKYITSNQADKVVQAFIDAQVLLDSQGKRHG